MPCCPSRPMHPLAGAGKAKGVGRQDPHKDHPCCPSRPMQPPWQAGGRRRAWGALARHPAWGPHQARSHRRIIPAALRGCVTGRRAAGMLLLGAPMQPRVMPPLAAEKAQRATHLRSGGAAPRSMRRARAPSGPPCARRLFRQRCRGQAARSRSTTRRRAAGRAARLPQGLSRAKRVLLHGC